MFSDAPKILALSQEFKEWEAKKEKLEGKRPDLLAVIMELQEADLAGNPDPKGLKAARADLADWDEKIMACSNRIAKIKEALALEVQERIEWRYQNLPKTKALIKGQQEIALQQIAKGLALIDFYQGHFFGPGHLVDAQLVTRERPDRQWQEDAVRQNMAAEMTRLEAENSDAQAFRGLQKEAADLEMIWAPRAKKTAKSPTDFVPGGPPMGASKEQWIAIHVKNLIRQARATAGGV